MLLRDLNEIAEFGHGLEVAARDNGAFREDGEGVDGAGERVRGEGGGELTGRAELGEIAAFLAGELREVAADDDAAVGLDGEREDFAIRSAGATELRVEGAVGHEACEVRAGLIGGGIERAADDDTAFGIDDDSGDRAVDPVGHVFQEEIRRVCRRV